MGRKGSWFSTIMKIKKLDPATKRVSTLAGTGKAGFKDGSALSAQLSEPAGIIEADTGRLFIAHTNNSLIRYLDPNKEDDQLVTLELKGVQPHASKSRSLKRLRKRNSADIHISVVDGGSSIEGDLNLQISLLLILHLKIHLCISVSSAANIFLLKRLG